MEKTAFEIGFEKRAGVRSEMVGTLLNPLGLVGALAGVAAGPYSKEQQAAAENKSWSNVLLPGAGGYRLVRRSLADEEHNKKIRAGQ